jgi:hypothetical protein
MSIAGSRSNRGDAYQLLVAMEWVLVMLSDERIEYVEVDTTSVLADGTPHPVDDVVIQFKDGRSICCQCKKNEPHFESWTVGSLATELKKAGQLLVADGLTTARFYSYGNFGELAKLADKASSTPDELAFRVTVGESLKPALAKLEQLWRPLCNGTPETVHTLLRRTQFVMTKTLQDYEAENLRTLAVRTCHAPRAFDAIWTRLHHVSADLSGPHNPLSKDAHRVRRDEVERLLESAGALIGAPRAIEDIERLFASMSAIGRSWRRQIAGETVPREAVNTLLAAINGPRKRVLLTDGPGFGKTCVLLALVDELETNANVAVLFLQAREFAEARGPEARAALGLDPETATLVARMSEHRHTVVVIDSLDVLSIARETDALTFFLSLIDRLSLVPNVTVIAACRSFDLRYEARLAERSWDETVTVGAFDWDDTVVPLLKIWGVEPSRIEQPTRELLVNARNLSLYADLVKRGSGRNVSTAQELTDAYLDAVVGADPRLGDPAMVGIELMAAEMLTHRASALPRNRLAVSDAVLAHLLSESVLFSGRTGYVTFGHQTLLDALAVRCAQRNRKTLRAFVETLPPVPFVRPAIRAYFIHLRYADRKQFRREVRALFAADVAFHIKRLLAESLAATLPEEDDWSLVHYLFKEQEVHFRTLYAAAKSQAWFEFWQSHLVPVVTIERNAGWLEAHARRVGEWLPLAESEVLQFWISVLGYTWIDQAQMRRAIRLELGRVKNTERDPFPLLEKLICEAERPDFIGDFLQRSVAHWDKGDALLWRYITCNVSSDSAYPHELDSELRCDGSWLRNQDLLPQRMFSSEELLDLAVSAIELWSARLSFSKGLDQWREGFLRNTSWRGADSNIGLERNSSTTILVRAIERAVEKHAVTASSWWQRNALRLCFSSDGALRYIGLLALSSAPELNRALAGRVLGDPRILEASPGYLLASALREAFFYLDDRTQDLVSRRILSTDDGLRSAQPWELAKRYMLLSAIPAPLRDPVVAACVDALARQMAPVPAIQVNSELVGTPPLDILAETLVRLGDATLLRLLADRARRRPVPVSEWWATDDDIDLQLQQASSRAPQRFLGVLRRYWSDMDARSRHAVFEGGIYCLRYRFGRLQPPTPDWKPIEEVDGPELADLILTELERHPTHWGGTRIAAMALEACAHVTRTEELANRVLFECVGLLRTETGTLRSDATGDNLLTHGMNSVSGEVAGALMTIANTWAEDGREIFPELLAPTLRRLAFCGDASVRAVLLYRLPFLQSRSALGWELFEAAMEPWDDRLATVAEACLYHTYNSHFGRIRPHLDRIRRSASAGALETWARISALSALSDHLSTDVLVEELEHMATEAAWSGAVSVWVANAKYPEIGAACIASLERAVSIEAAHAAIRQHASELFRDVHPPTLIPTGLLRRLVDGSRSDPESPLHIYGLDSWLAAMAQVDADAALDRAEVAATSVGSGAVILYDHEPIAILLTRLMREAEEREESDSGEMLRRVVRVQDLFLGSSFLHGLTQWLHDAERPDA